MKLCDKFCYCHFFFTFSNLDSNIDHYKIFITVSPSEGLSVERLTLLGKVHIARVMVDTLTLEPSEDENTPARSSLVRSNRASRLRGKPPRPAARANKKR